MIACCLTAAFSQGLYWQSTTDGMGGKNTEESFAIPKMMKVVRTGGPRGNSVIIIRLDKELLWNVQPEEKTYSEITFAEIEKMANKSSERMAAMKEKMKEMPEEQRKMMEKMMGGGDEQVEVNETDETKTITGHTCKKFIVLKGKKEFMTLWVANDVKEFKPLMADWKNFSERLSAMTARFAKGMGDVYKKINGFPMETSVSMMGNKITTTVTKIEKRTTPANEFEIPAGYKKVKSEMEGAMEKMGKED